MRRDAGGHQLVGCGFKRFGVVLFVQRVGGKNCGQQLGVGQNAACAGLWRALQPGCCLNVERKALRQWFERFRLLVGAVGKCFCHFGKFALRLLGFDFVFELAAHALKRGLGRGAYIGQFDDVVAKVGLHEFADFTLAHGKNRILKGFDHGSSAKKFQVATLGR